MHNEPPGAGLRNRAARLARCVNISRWFRFPASESAEHFQNFITDKDLDLLVALCVRGVRLTVAADQIIRPPVDDRPDPERLAYIDAAIARLTARGLAVVVVIHDVPRDIETSPRAAAAFVRFWSHLAHHLRAT